MDSRIQHLIGLLQAGRPGDAEVACRALLASRPADPVAWNLLGIALRQLTRLDEAEAAMRRAVGISGGNPEFRTNLAQLLGARGRLDDGIAEFHRAIAAAANFRPARLGLARVANQAGQPALAEEQARALIAADANDNEAWSALGTALHAQGLLAEATAAMQRAVTTQPNYPAARLNLAIVLAEQERAEDALEQVEAAARLGIAERRLGLTRARAQMQLDRYDAAEAQLEELVASNPDDIECQFMLAQLRHVRGDADFARSLRAAAARPGSPAATRAQYADVLRRSGQAVAAEGLIRELIRSEGPRPQLTSSLATILLESGRAPEAIVAAQAGADAVPDDVTIAENLVAALLVDCRPDRALPIIDRFHRMFRNDQRWITYRADAGRQRGEDLFAEWCDLERLVRVYQLEPPPGYGSIEEFHAELKPVLESRHRQATHPLDQSLRGGTQTSRGLLADPHPLIRTYLSLLATPLAEYQAAIGRDPAHPLLSRNAGTARPTGCWSVRLKRGGFHVNHIHPQGWISSAYYVSVPAEVEDTTVRSGWIKFGEPLFPTPACAAGRMIQPKPGRLVLFPSYLWHGTNPILGDEPRLTIAFDSLPTP